MPIFSLPDHCEYSQYGEIDLIWDSKSVKVIVINALEEI